MSYLVENISSIAEYFDEETKHFEILDMENIPTNTTFFDVERLYRHTIWHPETKETAEIEYKAIRRGSNIVNAEDENKYSSLSYFLEGNFLGVAEGMQGTREGTEYLLLKYFPPKKEYELPTGAEGFIDVNGLLKKMQEMQIKQQEAEKNRLTEEDRKKLNDYDEIKKENSDLKKENSGLKEANEHLKDSCKKETERRKEAEKGRKEAEKECKQLYKNMTNTLNEFGKRHNF